MPEVTFLPTQADYLTASRANYLSQVRSLRGAGRLFGVVLAVGCAVGAFLWWSEGEFDVAILYIVSAYAFVAFGCVGLNWLLLARRVRRMFDEQPGFSEPMSVAWSHEGITIDSPMTAHRLAWGRLARWRDATTALLLYLTRDSCVFVPKRALAADQLADLREELGANVAQR